MGEEKHNMRKLLLLAFFFSGMTALIYEIVWSRPLQLIFGSTIYAVSTILTTFLAGFGIGAYIFRNIADKSKNPVWLFSLLEFGIGIYGLILTYLFRVLPTIYLSVVDVGDSQFLQFTLIFVVLIIPTTLFGATWPVVNKAYITLSGLGKDVGLLYATNSFGAFLGPLITAFILIPSLGIQLTSIIASLANITIAIVLYVYSTKKWGLNE